jgi:hypothetical protein
MGCETTKILEDNASVNSASNNQAEEPKFNDFEELGSK